MPARSDAGKLDRLMSMDLPNVTVGIIPMGRELAVMPFNGFLMLDDQLAIETWSGKDEERGDEAAVHERIFDGLLAESATGDEARRLIAAAAAALRDGGNE